MMRQQNVPIVARTLVVVPFKDPFEDDDVGYCATKNHKRSSSKRRRRHDATTTNSNFSRNTMSTSSPSLEKWNDKNVQRKNKFLISSKGRKRNQYQNNNNNMDYRYRRCGDDQSSTGNTRNSNTSNNDGPPMMKTTKRSFSCSLSSSSSFTFSSRGGLQRWLLFLLTFVVAIITDYYPSYGFVVSHGVGNGGGGGTNGSSQTKGFRPPSTIPSSSSLQYLSPLTTTQHGSTHVKSHKHQLLKTSVSATSSSQQTIVETNHDAQQQQQQSMSNDSHESSLTQYQSGLPPPPSRNDGQQEQILQSNQTKKNGGEYTSNWISQMFYLYVTPLVKQSLRRNLSEVDAFDIPIEKQMNTVVPKLETQYSKEREHARRAVLKALKKQKRRHGKIGRLRRSIKKNKHYSGYKTLSDSSAVVEENKSSSPYAISESVVLGKALLKYQKGLLMQTALLRLANTAIQAFPALLVARLLRLIESKDASVLKSIRAAALLIFVLSTKMIIENQYFHRVVKYATQIRGSLTGIIFDKSLRTAASMTTTSVGTTTSTTTGSKKKKKKQKEPVDSITPSVGGTSIGSVLNLMQSDASILEGTAMQLHTIWDGPLQISIYTFLLYRYLGPSVLYGIAVLLTTIPINTFMLRWLHTLNQRENRAKDARTKRTTEAISQMKLLKLMGWEDQFMTNIQTDRIEELNRHVSRGIVRALNQAISNAVPAIVLVVTLTAYAKSGRPIVASTIFTAISLFNQLRFPLFFYPMLIDSLANGKNALRRVSQYLSSEEVIDYVDHLPALPSSSSTSSTTSMSLPSPHADESKAVGDGGEAMISMKNGHFLWSSSYASSSSPTSLPTTTSSNTSNNNSEAVATTAAAGSASAGAALVDASFDVKPGEIVAVVGNVGSGKSALMKALLGELVPVPRSAIIVGGDTTEASIATAPPSVQLYYSKDNLSYCAQEAWLPKGTLRDAVLFGRPYDKASYEAALLDAGLDGDMVNIEDVDYYEYSDNDNDEQQPQQLDASSQSLNTKEDASAPLQGILTHDTDVGEGGSSLSGGQRARVALARAFYHPPFEGEGGTIATATSMTATGGAGGAGSIYLLDDPLAALDATVGSIVFDRLVKRVRRERSATLLVTNDPTIPQKCDRIIIVGKTSLSGGNIPTILDQGTYRDLKRRGHNLDATMTTSEEEEDDEEEGISTTTTSTTTISNLVDQVLVDDDDEDEDDEDDMVDEQQQQPGVVVEVYRSNNATDYTTNVEHRNGKMKKKQYQENEERHYHYPTYHADPDCRPNQDCDPILLTDQYKNGGVVMDGDSDDEQCFEECVPLMDAQKQNKWHQGLLQQRQRDHRRQSQLFRTDGKPCAPSWTAKELYGKFNKNETTTIASRTSSTVDEATTTMTSTTTGTVAPKPSKTDSINNVSATRDDDGQVVASVSAVSPAQGTITDVATTTTTPTSTSTTNKPKRPASTDDQMSTEAVPLRTYLSYLKSVQSPLLIMAMLGSYLMVNGAQFYQQFVVAKWTEVGSSSAAAGSISAALGSKYLTQLANAAIVVSTFLWLRSFLLMKVGVRASTKYHQNMLKSVIRAPLQFFDATPSGQLISRFGKELETVDRSLPDGIGSVLFCVLQIISSLMALAGVVTPGMLVPLTAVGYFYLQTMKHFRPAARDLKRSESKSRSPIYTHFKEALRGTETIRSFGGGRRRSRATNDAAVSTDDALGVATKTWSLQHRQLTDSNLSVFYTVKSLDRWLSVRLESLGNAVTFSAAAASILLTKTGKMKSGNAGWGLTQSLAITSLMTWAVRCLTDLESQMMSLMRIEEITDMTTEENENETNLLTSTKTSTNFGNTDSVVQRSDEETKRSGDKKKKKKKKKAVETQSTMPKEYRDPGTALDAAVTVPVERTNDKKEVSSSFSESKLITFPTSPHKDVALKRSGWPWKGHVEFQNVFMRYNPYSPLVLQDVSLNIPAGSTLGVVGRSGSGKSSLLLALFRLVEIEGAGGNEIDSDGEEEDAFSKEGRTFGQIRIDGVDIRSVGLKTLRSSLSIIPQDPVLFAGTVKYNLDATGQASDADAWDALTKASPELAEQFLKEQQGLDTLLSEGGKNLSQGQRQLICLARALLRKSKILVLDEATSSVDPQTDAQVQSTIQREFVAKGVTVITVAHRLDTVLGYDNICVLGAGRVLEVGPPTELLKKRKGALRQLVLDRKKQQDAGGGGRDGRSVGGLKKKFVSDGGLMKEMAKEHRHERQQIMQEKQNNDLVQEKKQQEEELKATTGQKSFHQSIGTTTVV